VLRVRGKYFSNGQLQNWFCFGKYENILNVNSTSMCSYLNEHIDVEFTFIATPPLVGEVSCSFFLK